MCPCTMQPTEVPQLIEAVMSPVLSRDEILTAEDHKLEQIAVPEWGGIVYVRVVSGYERDQFEASLSTGSKQLNLHNFRARFAVLVLCDSDEKPLFNNADITALGKKSAAALDRIFDAGRRLNRMSDKDVDELVGNSDSGPNISSGSDSPKS